jgi:hypothetical protein
MTELERLGRVGPPAPGVLDAAREVLWSAVAAEMLATAPPDAARHAGDPAARGNQEEPRRKDSGAT